MHPSPHPRLICLDIETVPDRAIMPADWPADKFPKPLWHEVVAISFVEARIERDPDTGRERYEVTACRSGGEVGWSERQLLQAFWRFFAETPARVVTWNGRGFDLPVMKLRSMLHGLTAEGWFTSGTKWETYGQRYASGWHCDLMEQLSDYGACTKLALDDVARGLGLPGKLGGHGSEVAGMVERGALDQVRAYCEADCLNLFVLYARWALLTGALDAEGHDASLAILQTYLEQERASRPHLGEFLDRWKSPGDKTALAANIMGKGSS